MRPLGEDPYLRFAELVNFKGFAAKPAPQGEEHEIRVFVEIAANIELTVLTNLGLIIDPIFVESSSTGDRLRTRFVLARTTPTVIRSLLSSKIILQFQLSLAREDGPLSTYVSEFHQIFGNENGLESGGPHGVEKKYVAIIDDGLPFAHPLLHTESVTRLALFWHQGLEDFFCTGPQVQHGLAFATDRELYASILPEPYSRLEEGGRHGMGLVSLVAENKDANFILIQLPTDSAKDSSGGALDGDLWQAIFVLGLMFASNIKNLTILTGYGTTAGPHDGSTLFERALADFYAQKPTLKQLVMPGGNARLEALHGSGSLKKGKSAKFNWFLPPADSTHNFLELWVPEPEINQPNYAGLKIRIAAPGEAITSVPWIPPNQESFLPNPMPTMFVCNQGKRILIAVTDTVFGSASAIGAYQIEIKLADSTQNGISIAFNVWIERDGPAIGSNSSGRASYLTGPCSHFEITDKSTLGRFCASPHVAAIGALQSDALLPEDSDYCAQGPAIAPAIKQTLDGKRFVPDHAGLGGLLVEGVYADSSGDYFGGTSAAAALYVRDTL